MRFSHILALTAALAGYGTVHPGHDVYQDMKEREAALKDSPRDLSHCAEKMKARDITAEAVARRGKVLREARRARGLETGKYLQA